MGSRPLITMAAAIIISILLQCSDSTEPEKDEIAPSVIITNPAANSTLVDPVIIKADATDNVGVDSVTFMIDGEVMGSDKTPPYEQLWNVGYWADGNVHTILANAVDKSGNVGQSELVSVTVSEQAMISPVLVSPSNNTIFRGSNIANLIWNSLINAIQYEIFIASDSMFQNVVFTQMTTDTSLVTPQLLKGSYYWKVRAQNIKNLLSGWSTVNVFRIDGPAQPVLMLPENNSKLPTGSTPILVWHSSNFAVNYNVIVSKNPNFNLPVYEETVIDTQTTLSILDSGQEYYWHVSAGNSIGIIGEFSNTFQFYISPPPDSSLLCFYPFNGNADDESIYGNNGTVFGAVLTDDRFGNPKSSYHFDGVDDYIDIGNASLLKPSFPMTIASWVRLNSYGTTNPIFTNNFDQNLASGIWLNFTVNGISAINYGDSGPLGPQTRKTKIGTSILQLNIWYHVVGIIYNNSDMDIFVNGVNDGGNYNGLGTVLAYTNGSGNIGRKDGGMTIPPTSFNGDIDEINFYDRALTEQEVYDLYNNTKPSNIRR